MGSRTRREGRRLRFKPVLSSLVVATLGLGALAGCGSSSSSSSSSGGRSFVSGAEAACAGANEQIAALGTPQQAEVLGYLESTEAVIEKLDREVRALDAAGAAEAEYAAALGKAVPVLIQMTNAARNENFDAVRELSDRLIELRLGDLAEAAELKACAEVPVSSS